MADLLTKIYRNKVVFLVAFFLLIIVAFSLVFMVIEGKTYLDSIYWAVVTLATVGYGDIAPTTPTGKIFAMILIVLGITMYGLIIQTLGTTMVEKVFKEVMGMKDCNYKGHVVIAGWDQLAEELLLELIANKIEVAVIIENPDNVQRIKNMGAFVVAGNPTKDQTLLSSGIKNARVVVITTENDLDVLVTALKCKSLKRDVRIVAKINNTEIIEVVKEAGVRIVINPSVINSRLLASAAFEPHIVEFLEEVTTARVGNDLREFDVPSSSALVGKTVIEMLTEFRKQSGLLIVGLIKDGKTLPNPPDDMVINAGDGVILLGKREHFENAKRLINP